MGEGHSLGEILMREIAKILGCVALFCAILFLMVFSVVVGLDRVMLPIAAANPSLTRQIVCARACVVSMKLPPGVYDCWKHPCDYVEILKEP